MDNQNRQHFLTKKTQGITKTDNHLNKTTQGITKTTTFLGRGAPGAIEGAFTSRSLSDENVRILQLHYSLVHFRGGGYKLVVVQGMGL